MTAPVVTVRVSPKPVARQSRNPVPAARSRREVRPAVAVIGAGASGALTAVHLLDRGARVWLIDPAPDTGRGIAYRTPDVRHRLNVCAGSMSALPDDPEHFLRWATGRVTAVASGDYLPRWLYGEYLAAVLADSAARQLPGSLQRIHRAAVAVHRVRNRYQVTLGDSNWLTVDAAVLAIGNSPPSTAWAPARLLAAKQFVADPWAPAALDRLRDGAPALLVGSGLTMVDVALTAAAVPEQTAITALSRSGLLPGIHEPGLHPRFDPPTLPAGSLRLHDVAAALRLRAIELGSWAAAVDTMRPITSQVWRRLPTCDQAEFLHRYARRWDVLRHRMAPDVGEAFRQLQREQRLTVRTGHVEDARPGAIGVAVRVGDSWHEFGHVVNCTGPCANLARRVDHPLLLQLISAGLARTDPLGLGLDTDPAGAVLDPERRPTPGLWAVGPVRRPALWESTAIPEIRCQAADVAADVLVALRH